MSTALLLAVCTQSPIIWADSFDSDPKGRYWEYNDANGSFVFDPSEGHDSKGSMRCDFKKGQVDAGWLHLLFGRNPFGKGAMNDRDFREIWWRVYMKTESGWEGNPAKLGRATCLAGRDYSQGLFAHVWGGKGDALCLDPATGIQNDVKVTTRYNDFPHMKWLGISDGKDPIYSTQESGRWRCIESHIKLNTPGNADGEFDLWIDGKLDASRKGLNWHGRWKDYAINAVFLENYWNSGAMKAESRWFDDFVVSTKPIGL